MLIKDYIDINSKDEMIDDNNIYISQYNIRDIERLINIKRKPGITVNHRSAWTT